MNPPSPLPARRRRRLARAVLAAAAVLLVLPVLAWGFRDAWLKPAIRHYVMSHSGRSFDFDELHLRFAGGLDPTVEFRNLRIQNAPWADGTRPLVAAGRLAATFAWRSLFESGRTIVTLLVLEDAQVDLERQADGLRNWRLGHPDDRGPPRVRILALDARASTLHVAHRGIGLDGVASIAALPAPRPLADRPGPPLTRRLAFRGTFEGRPFDGEAAVSDVLGFGAPDRRFSFDGRGRIAGLRLEAHGLASDLHAPGDADFDARLASDGDGDLWPLPLREGLARVRPLAASAHVVRAGPAWTATGLRMTLGRRTHAAGELRVVDDPDGRRRRVQATVREALLDVADLRALGGPATGPGATARTPPDDALVLEKLRAYDAVVDVRDARFANSERGLAQSLSLHATLERGVLAADPFDFGTAGGHVTGTLRFDASKADAELAVTLQARGLRLEQLSEKLATSRSLEGRIDGRASLRSQGASPRALVRAATGTIEATLGAGASVTQRLDARLGLDGGAWLRSLFDKSGRVPVECAALVLEVAHGVGTARRLAFETAHTALAGRGRVDFVEQTIAADVMPSRKDRALLALDRSLHASGPWQDVRVSIAPPISGVVPDRCPR